MIDANIEAILVKVAVMGLKPQLHLGQTLQEMHPILLDLNRQVSAFQSSFSKLRKLLFQDFAIYMVWDPELN